MFTQNRATLHLHGGRTPWISDGTPHQWTTPAGESTSYPKGVSVKNVPDMPDPGDGSITFFYSNQQSARLMFYHDHAWGITRLNVYVGEAAGYLITDQAEQDLITAGLLPPFLEQIPSIIQIGTEGGFLPTPVVWPNTPIGFERNPKDIVVGNVKEHNLFLGPAERADILIDFSQFAGKTIIFYNDAPAAVPAADSRLDYYTCDVDQTTVGGRSPTLPGYGPNTRTIMQFRVAAADPANPPVAYNLATLQAAFASTTATPGVFAKSQDPILVPQGTSTQRTNTLIPGYNTAYSATFPTGTTAYARIQSTSLTFNPLDLSTPAPAVGDLVATAVTLPFPPKAIQELFENDYGRMNATLGVELKFTNGANQTTIPYGYVDPPTESITDTPNTTATPIGAATDGTQIWKITHNGVDTHPVHFHLFDVQLINRVGWDGAVRAPEENELGWKETVRMNPLEDCIVALRPSAPKPPFGLPDSMRPLNPMMPLGVTGAAGGFSGIGPDGNPVTVTNVVTNFGWEYVWHCHILSHEEMDMMRPMVFNVDRRLPAAPVLTAGGTPGTAVNLSWTDAKPFLPVYPQAGNTWGSPGGEIGFRVERAPNNGTYTALGTTLANATMYTDTSAAVSGTDYNYRVVAFNVAGEAASNVVLMPGPPAAPSNLTATAVSPTQVNLAWKDNAGNETGFQIQRATGAGAFATIATAGANVTSYSDTTAAANTTYSYRVLAVNAYGNSAPSNVATVTTPGPPAAPSNLAAALVAGPQVNLTWTDNATNETGFQVQRATGAGAFATIGTVGANVTSYSDTTVAAGTTYRYQVLAVNTAGSSAPSNIVTVVVPPAPAAPARLTVALASGPLRASLTFFDNATNETGFVVERATGTGAFAAIATLAARNATGGVTYADTTIAVGTTYSYRVKALNDVVSSAYSNTVTVAVPAVPAAPSNLTATAIRGGFSDQVTLRWTDNSNNENNFVIQRSTNAAFTAGLTSIMLGANATSYTQTGLSRGATYYYRISALNTISGGSAWANATPFPVTTP